MNSESKDEEPSLFPIEVKVRFPLEGLGDAQIQELKATIIKWYLGYGFEIKAPGFWMQRNDAIQGYIAGIHIAGLDWQYAWQTNKTGSTEILIRGNVTLAGMSRGSLGVNTLQEAYAEAAAKNPSTASPYPNTQPDVHTFSGPTPGNWVWIPEAAYSIGLRIKDTLEATFGQGFKYVDANAGFTSVGSQSALMFVDKASLTWKINSTFSLSFYAQQDRTFENVELVADKNLKYTLPEKQLRFIQVGGKFLVSW